MDASKCKKLIQIMQNAYNILKEKKRSIDEVKKWCQFSTQNIKLLNKRLKCEIHISEKTRIIATIAALKQIKLKIKNLENQDGRIHDDVRRRQRV